ncbi:pathogen-associated molecular patterns-induced protein A70-like [Cornus florida]|uniref:pathogen-associated molecular patterns-induced protein A70-like n=1 Tax=Cornus florida TaxID=4283 RepID=UPI00289F3067|nr:pathogen-associated molecular patterns-induced protein A70-like [Cornus florida]
MFEDSVSSSVPSIWASMNSWFTPAVLFVLLNVMIGTIFVTSSLANQRQQPQTQEDPHQQQQQPRLARSPSVLQRLKSIDFSIYRSKEPNPAPPSIVTHFNLTPDSDTHYPPQHIHQQQNLETLTQFVSQHTHQQQTQETETQYVPEQVIDEIGDNRRTIDEIYSELTDDHRVIRTMSDTMPASGEVPAKLPAKMRKSASLKSAFGHFEEEDIVEARRPATVREGKAKVTEGDEQVDAKADDFINRFRQQLKLQRLDSFIRYKDMIGRGSGK